MTIISFHLWNVNILIPLVEYTMYMRKFGECLKYLRTEKQLSIDQLSKQVGLGAATISRWENGLCDIKSDQLIILAKYFDVSTDYLLGLEE